MGDDRHDHQEDSIPGANQNLSIVGAKVTWNAHGSTIAEAIVEWYRTKEWSDVTIGCEGKFIKAHRMVLATVPYFRTLLEYASELTEHPLIVITGVKYESMRALLEYMYTGEVKVTRNELISLRHTARVFRIYTMAKVLANFADCGSGSYKRSNPAANSKEKNMPTHSMPSTSTSKVLSNDENKNYKDSLLKNKPFAFLTRQPLRDPLNSGTDNDKLGNRNTRLHSDQHETYFGDFGSCLPLPHMKVEPKERNPPKRRARKRRANPTSTVREMLKAKERNQPSGDVLELARDYPDANTQNALALVSYSYGQACQKLNSSSTNQEMTVEVDPNSYPCRTMGGVVPNIKIPTSNMTRTYPGEVSPGKPRNGNGAGSSSMGVDMSMRGKPIRRPPNAFMIFSNSKRRELASANPTLKNNEISVLLGQMWKQLNTSEQSLYYEASLEAHEAHKKLYPDYVYSPQTARLRKELKRQINFTPTRLKYGDNEDPVAAGRAGPAPADNSATQSADEDSCNAYGDGNGSTSTDPPAFWNWNKFIGNNSSNNG